MQITKKPANFTLILIALLITASFVFASTPGDISTCQIIDTPGTYNLTTNITNITANCFAIYSSNVTLNGNGRLIEGTNTLGMMGVTVYNSSNVTVRNLKIKNFGGCTTGCGGQGMAVWNTSNSTFSNLEFINNVYMGASIYRSSNVALTDSNISGSTSYGISLLSNYSPNQINNIRVNGGAYGIFIGDTNSALLNNIYVSNTSEGITLVDSNRNTITNYTAEANNYPLVFARDSYYNQLSTLKLVNNNSATLILTESNNNTFFDVSITGSSPGSFYGEDSFQTTADNLNIFTQNTDSWWLFNTGSLTTLQRPFATYNNLTLGNRYGSVKTNRLIFSIADAPFISLSDINITQNLVKIRGAVIQSPSVVNMTIRLNGIGNIPAPKAMNRGIICDSNCQPVRALGDGNYEFIATVSRDFNYAFSIANNPPPQVVHFPPAITITSATTIANDSNQSIVLAFSATTTGATITKYYVSDNNINWIDNNLNTTYTFLNQTAGTHRYYVKADDNFGLTSNIASASATIVPIIIAPAPNPVVTIGAPTSSNSTTPSITINYSATASASTITNYYISDNNTAWIDNNLNTSFTFQNQTIGTHNYYVKADDNFGHMSSTASITVNITQSNPGTTTITSQPTVNGQNYYQIDSCMTIDKNGVYDLNRDIDGINEDCFVITSSNVILNGNRNTIRGVGAAASDYWGVAVLNASNVSIIGLQIKNFGDSNCASSCDSGGLYAQNMRRSSIENVSANLNSRGAYLDNSSNNEISNLNTNYNKYGLGLNKSTNNSFENLTNYQNTHGISLLFNSNNNSFTLTNTVENSEGIIINASKNNSFRAINSSKNKGYGLNIQNGASSNTFEDVLLKDNDYGLSIDSSKLNLFNMLTIENPLSQWMQVMDSNAGTEFSHLTLKSLDGEIEFELVKLPARSSIVMDKANLNITKNEISILTETGELDFLKDLNANLMLAGVSGIINPLAQNNLKDCNSTCSKIETASGNTYLFEATLTDSSINSFSVKNTGTAPVSPPQVETNKFTKIMISNDLGQNPKSIMPNGMTPTDLEIKRSVEREQTFGGKYTFTLTLKNKSTEDMNGLRIVESIPKNVAENVSQLTFSIQPTRIIKSDPIVQWDINSLKKGATKIITYRVATLASPGLDGPNFTTLFNQYPAPITAVPETEQVIVQPPALCEPTQCDDNDLCTEELCIANKCVHKRIETNECKNPQTEQGNLLENPIIWGLIIVILIIAGIFGFFMYRNYIKTKKLEKEAEELLAHPKQVAIAPKQTSNKTKAKEIMKETLMKSLKEAAKETKTSEKKAKKTK